VLLPCLFNFFTSDFPEVNGLEMSFADDFNIAVTSPSLKDIETALNEDLVKIFRWAKRKRLKISAEKSQVIYFTLWNREKETPKIFYKGVQIPLTKTMKSLGILFDSAHTMTPNRKASSTKGRGRVPIIKAVMGADWGFSLEDGLLTYKQALAILAPSPRYYYREESAISHS
jgi:hypothetical protein